MNHRSHPTHLILLAVLCTLTFGCKREPPALVSSPPPAVTVSQPLAREVIDYDQYTGRTVAVEEVAVRARVSGYLIKINFKDGVDVQKGDLLFQIDPRPFEAEVAAVKGQVAQWESKLARADADVARLERLLPKGAASQKDMDAAIADRGEARAAIQSARAAVEKATLNLEFTKVTAPINGRVSRRLVTEGNLISADATLLTTIVTIDPMYAYFDVDEHSILRYQQLIREKKRESARSGHMPVYLGLANEEGFPHQGVIDFVDNQVNPTTGTIRLRGVFSNDNRFLIPGEFVRLRYQGSGEYQALLIPDRAIGSDQGQRYVFVVNEQNTAERRPVTLGPLHDHGLRVIRSGIQAGEWIIENGLQRVRPGVTVAPQRVKLAAQEETAQTSPPSIETPSAPPATVRAER